jgi:hypothetical protein
MEELFGLNEQARGRFTFASGVVGTCSERSRLLPNVVGEDRTANVRLRGTNRLDESHFEVAWQVAVDDDQLGVVVLHQGFRSGCVIRLEDQAAGQHRHEHRAQRVPELARSRRNL